jgi:beta-hydroxylase
MTPATTQPDQRIGGRRRSDDDDRFAAAMALHGHTSDHDAVPIPKARHGNGAKGLSSQGQSGVVVSLPGARGLMERAAMRAVQTGERLNLAYPKIAGNPMVYGAGTFPWEAGLERATPAILSELAAVLNRQAELPSFREIVKDVDLATSDELWKTFFLCGYGVKSERNIQSCPRTWEAVKAIPGLKTAMFSIMEPGTHLPAHRGPYNGVLRAHLGLIIPEPSQDVAIRVGEVLCHWRAGKVIVFDDAYEHEAWNHTGATRVVLFIDFVKPLRFPASVVNWCLLTFALFSPFVREATENQSSWERRFYAH